MPGICTLIYTNTDTNSLSANPTKWSNTLKQFINKLPTNYLSVLDHFVGLALKGLKQYQKGSNFSTALTTFAWSHYVSACLVCNKGLWLMSTYMHKPNLDTNLFQKYLKVQSCKLYKNKVMIDSTYITNIKLSHL